MNNKKKNNKPEKPAEADETTKTKPKTTEYKNGDIIEWDGEKYLYVDTGKEQLLISEYEHRLTRKRVVDFVHRTNTALGNLVAPGKGIELTEKEIVNRLLVPPVKKAEEKK